MHNKFNNFLKRVDLIHNQVEREELREQEAKRKRKQRIQEQNRQNHLRYQEQLRSEMAARYFHAVQSTGGASGGGFTNEYSLQFDGVDEHAKGSTTFSELDGTNKFTLSMWIKPTNLTSSRILYHIQRNTTQSHSQVLVWLATDGQLQISVNATSTFCRSTISAITAGVWQHLLICFDLSQALADNRIRPFVNGVDKFLIANNPPSTFPVSTGPVFVGEEANGYLAPFLGNIDEVAMWSTDERSNVASIYNGGVPFDLTTLASPPAHYYRMGDGDTYSSGQWDLLDNVGSYDLKSINMEVGDRVADVP